MPLKILVEYYAVSTGKAADVSKCRQLCQSTRRKVSEDLNPQQHSLLNAKAEYKEGHANYNYSNIIILPVGGQAESLSTLKEKETHKNVVTVLWILTYV